MRAGRRWEPVLPAATGLDSSLVLNRGRQRVTPFRPLGPQMVFFYHVDDY